MNEAPIPVATVVEQWPILRHLGLLALVGLIVGLGQTLSEQPKFSFRVAIGHCVTSTAMGVAAAGVLTWLPTLPLVAQCGVAAATASLGTTGLTAIFQKFLGISPK